MSSPTTERTLKLREIGPARRGTRPDEVVIALSPALNTWCLALTVIVRS